MVLLECANELDCGAIRTYAGVVVIEALPLSPPSTSQLSRAQDTRHRHQQHVSRVINRSWSIVQLCDSRLVAAHLHFGERVNEFGLGCCSSETAGFQQRVSSRLDYVGFQGF